MKDVLNTAVAVSDCVGGDIELDAPHTFRRAGSKVQTSRDVVGGQTAVYDPVLDRTTGNQKLRQSEKG